MEEVVAAARQIEQILGEQSRLKNGADRPVYAGADPDLVKRS